MPKSDTPRPSRRSTKPKSTPPRYALLLNECDRFWEGTALAEYHLPRDTARAIKSLAKATGNSRLPSILTSIIETAVLVTRACVEEHRDQFPEKPNRPAPRKYKLGAFGEKHEFELLCVEFEPDGSGTTRAARTLTPAELKAIREVARKQRVPLGSFFDSMLSEAIATEVESPRTARFPRSRYRKGSAR